MVCLIVGLISVFAVSFYKIKENKVVASQDTVTSGQAIESLASDNLVAEDFKSKSISSDIGNISFDEVSKDYIASPVNGDEFTRTLTNEEQVRIRAFRKDYEENKDGIVDSIVPLKYDGGENDFYLSVETLVFNVPKDRALTNEEIKGYVDFTEKIDLKIAENLPISSKVNLDEILNFKDNEEFEKKSAEISQELFGVSNTNDYTFEASFNSASVFPEDVVVVGVNKGDETDETIWFLFKKDGTLVQAKQRISNKYGSGADYSQVIKSNDIEESKFEEYILKKVAGLLDAKETDSVIEKLEKTERDLVTGFVRYKVSIKDLGNYIVLFSGENGSIVELDLEDYAH